MLRKKIHINPATREAILRHFRPPTTSNKDSQKMRDLNTDLQRTVSQEGTRKILNLLKLYEQKLSTNETKRIQKRIRNLVNRRRIEEKKAASDLAETRKRQKLLDEIRKPLEAVQLLITNQRIEKERREERERQESVLATFFTLVTMADIE